MAGRTHDSTDMGCLKVHNPSVVVLVGLQITGGGGDSYFYFQAQLGQ